MIRHHSLIATENHRNDPFEKPKVLIASVMAMLGLLTASTGANGQTISLGAAQDFAIVSAAGVTNSGPTVISGNIALSPGTSITGFAVGEGTVAGTVHSNDELAIQAQADALAAYNALAGLTPTLDKSGLDLGGMTLTPGVYYFSTSASLTGKLTLDTLGDPNALFVFQIGSTLTTTESSSVVVTGIGSGSDPNVFWQVGTSTTLGTRTLFYGDLITYSSISLGTNAGIKNGRAIALTGAVTLLSNDISIVPEPATWTMLLGGLGVLGFWNWQRMRRHSNG